MICLASSMPLLRVGHHDVAHYEARWLEDVLRRAAASAGHAQWWPAADVARGVIQFLRDRFQRNIITLQELFGRIGQTLQGIGFPEIADCVRPEPPPMELCLLELATETPCGFELQFFRRLADEVRDLREIGATRLHCLRTREAIRRMVGVATWTPACGALETEVVLFIRDAVGETNPDSPLAVLLT